MASPRSAPADDPVPYELDSPSPGRVILRPTPDTLYVLRRVTVEDLEELTLSLADLQDELAAIEEQAEAAGSTRAKLELQFSERRKMLGWWAAVVARLCPDGPAWPDEGVDAAFAGGELATEVFAVWNGRPRVPGA